MLRQLQLQTKHVKQKFLCCAYPVSTCNGQCSCPSSGAIIYLLDNLDMMLTGYLLVAQPPVRSLNWHLNGATGTERPQCQSRSRSPQGNWSIALKAAIINANRQRRRRRRRRLRQRRSCSCEQSPQLSPNCFSLSCERISHTCNGENYLKRGKEAGKPLMGRGSTTTAATTTTKVASRAWQCVRKLVRPAPDTAGIIIVPSSLPSFFLLFVALVYMGNGFSTLLARFPHNFLYWETLFALLYAQVVLS